MADDTRFIKEKRTTIYQKWLQQEGIPVISGQYVEDLNEVEVQPWARKGGKGVYINHDASDKSNDCYIAEIAPGGSLNPERHLFEEMIYVLQGRGATTIWTTTGGKQTFEWNEGSLFAVPLNAHAQHFNGQGDQPARLLGVTNAPLMMNTFESIDFIFKCDYPFPERFQGEENYFSGEGSLRGMVWSTNFVPDVRRFELLDYSERGADSTNVKYNLAKNKMGSHVSEFPVGTYKKGHRHGAGAHVIILGGDGYSLMWEDGKPVQQYPWKPGTLIVPPDRYFHQHFNTGPTPARYLALRLSSNQDDTIDGVPRSTIDRKLGGDQIEYEDESPEVRRLFIDGCRSHGAEARMDKFWAAAPV